MTDQKKNREKESQARQQSYNAQQLINTDIYRVQKRQRPQTNLPKTEQSSNNPKKKNRGQIKSSNSPSPSQRGNRVENQKPNKKVKPNQDNQASIFKLLPQCDLVSGLPENNTITRRKMKRLYTPYLPQFGKLFKRMGSETVFSVSTIRLNLKKNPSKYWYFNETHENRAARAVVNDNSQGYLVIFQTLAFCYLNFDKFRDIFFTQKQKCQRFQEIKAAYQMMKLPKRDYILWPVALLEPLNFQQEEFSQIFQRQMIEGLKEVVDLNPDNNVLRLQPVQVDRTVTRQLDINEFQEQDQGLPLKEPSQQRNPYPERSSPSLSPNVQSISRISKQQSGVGSQQAFQTVQFPQNQQINQLEFSDQWQNQKQQARISKIFQVWFIGSLKYQTVDSNIIVPWQSLNKEQLEYIFRKTRFTVLTKQIETYIQSINKFQKCTQMDLKVDQVKSFLQRVVSVKPGSNQENQNALSLSKESFRQQLRSYQSQRDLFKGSFYGLLAVALRYKNDIISGKRVVLVKYLDSGIRQWVCFDRVKVNYTSPKLTDQQLILLYLLTENNLQEHPTFRSKFFNNQIILELFYRDFYYRKSEIKSIFRNLLSLKMSMNPENITLVQQERKIRKQKSPTFMICQICSYAIYDMPFRKCQFCADFCHQECSTQIQHSWAQNTWSPWLCPKCQSCRTCFGMVGKQQNGLQCKKCSQIFHFECGKIKGTNSEQVDSQKFVCQNCLRCIMCKNRIKDRDYQYIHGDFFCSKCSNQRQKGDFCNVCLTFQEQKSKTKSGTTKWIQCQKQQCKRWIHQKCDPNIFPNKNTPVPQVYYCIFCRRVQKRNILSQILNVIKNFDQCQFFTEPTYEQFADYRTIVSNPMCISLMIKKCGQGQYDQDPKLTLISDFDLIVSNALLYNMPKDNAHYRARLLNIMGKQVFKWFAPYFTIDDQKLQHNSVFEQMRDSQINFFKYVYDHYPQLILNFQATKNRIQVIKKPMKSPLTYKFNSHNLLVQVFRESSIRFILEKTQRSIEDLFTVVKLQKGVWSNVNGIECCFHPGQKAKYICNQCCQSYCCLQECKRHNPCPRCDKLGCSCEKFGCMCKPISKQAELDIKNKLSQLQNPWHEVTENNRYCYKCCKEAKNRVCYFCKGLLFQFYQKCKTCSKMYHLVCDKNRTDINLFKYNSSRIEGYCVQCAYSNNQANINATEQALFMNSKEKIIKINKINRYIEIIQQIYKHAGVRTSIPMIRGMLYNNFDQFSSRQNFFNEFEMNRQIVLKNHKSSRRILAIQEQVAKKRLIGNDSVEIQRMNQQGHIKIDSKYEKASHSFSQFLKTIQRDMHITSTDDQRLTILKIQSSVPENNGWKIYQDLKLPYHFSSQEEYLQYYRGINEEINSRIYPQIVPFKTSAFRKSDLLLTTSLYQHELNYLKPFSKRLEVERIKIRTVFRRHFLYQRQVQLNKLIVTFRMPKFIQELQKSQQKLQIVNKSLNYSISSASGMDTERNVHVSTIDLEQSKQKDKVLRDYVNYLFYVKQKQREFLSETLVSNILAKQQLSMIIPDYLLSHDPPSHKSLEGKRLSYYQRTEHKCWKQLESFLLKIYEESRTCLRKGSTCVVKSQKNQHRVLKKWRIDQKFIDIKLWKKQERPRPRYSYNQDFVQNLNASNQASSQKDCYNHLGKQENGWCLTIDEHYYQVKSIDQIKEAIYRKMEVKLHSFDQLARFLGFTINDPYYMATHFTNFLQTTQIDKLTIPERMQKVREVCKDFQWQQGGVYKTSVKQVDSSIVQKKFNMTKRDIFYLKKRNKKEVSSRKQETPYITFEDMKHDFYPRTSNLVNGSHAQKLNVLSSTEIQNFQKRQQNDDTFIAPSKIHKLGIFARRTLRKNTIVIEYKGQIVSQTVADKRQSQFHLGCYMFGLSRRGQDKRDIIDATFRGNMARYLNHSCDPNCKATIQSIDNHPRILIYTMRQIQQYEQLTYDYQFRVQNTNQKLACTCGAKNCQGRLN